MAQTITASRGNGTSIANSTYTTLYTNSASGSSRVIINSFALCQIGVADTCNSALYILNSGGSLYIPFAVYRQGTINILVQVYVPGSIPVGSVNNTQGYGFVGIFSNANLNDTSPNALSWNYSGTSTISNGWHLCPKSIWLNPSDTIVVRQNNGASNTMNAHWNFTIITET
jgi:hypothetical protein